eukprot:c4380_g1_i1 orf=189-389(+)
MNGIGRDSYLREGSSSVLNSKIMQSIKMENHPSDELFRALKSVKNAVLTSNPHLDTGHGNRLRSIF